MKLKQWMQLAAISAGIITLAACSTHKKQDDAAINDANASYSEGAQSSGLGDGSDYGDADGARNQLAKRTYYFDYDSNVVRDEDRGAVIANADYLVSHPKMNVILEGHTDPRGSREYNIGLGERRAKAVADILTAKGVNPAQIRVVSYGAEKLASPGHTEADFQRDRRVVLVYLKR